MTATTCEGDGISGYNSDEKCYREDACAGCEKCWVKCEPKCDNCPVLLDKLRNPEPGDWVVVQTPILDLEFKGKWTAAMDLAVGRVAWVKNGNPVDGFTLKFTSTEKDILEQFKYPLTCVRLAMPNDIAIDKMIKVAKEGSVNEEM